VYIQYSNDMEGKQNPLLERIPVVSNNDNKELLNMNKYDLDLFGMNINCSCKDGRFKHLKQK